MTDRQLSWDLPPKPKAWPRYRNREQVTALRVTDIGHAVGGGATLYFGPDHDPEFMPCAWCVLSSPHIGGFLLRTEHGPQFMAAADFRKQYEALP